MFKLVSLQPQNLLVIMFALMLTCFPAIGAAQDAVGETGAAAIPPSCPRGDNVNTIAYYDAAAHYCLLVPVGYTIESEDAATLRITTADAAAPLQTELQLMVGDAAGQTLADIQTAQAEALKDTDATLEESRIAGIPALLITQLAAEPTALQAIWLRDEALFTLTVTPYDEQLWRTVAASLHFPPPLLEAALPKAPTPPDECPVPSENTQLAYQPVGYFCFLYPTEFTATAGATTGGIFVLPTTPAEDAPPPTLGITVNIAPDVTLEDIEDNLSDQVSDTDIEFETITISGIEAIVTDDLPSNIGNRQAFLLANNLLYLFTLTPVDSAFPAASEQAEAVWTTMLNSFMLITPPEAIDRPVIQTLFNARFGYSLIYPAGFQVSEQPDGSVELTEQRLTPDAPQTRFSIFALPAQGRTLFDFQTEIEAQNADVELQFTPTTIGGEPAIVTDKLPALAANRQAFFVYDDTLFILVLIPYDETLWQTFTEDFEFINITEGSPLQVNLDAMGAALLLPETWRLTQFGATYYINSATGSIPLVTLRRDDSLSGGTETAAFVAQVETRLLPDTRLEGTTIGAAAIPALQAIPPVREQICQVLYLPRDGFTLVLTINRPACAADGTISSPEVQRLLDSLAVYTPIIE
jgi:hypothetical protein